ncbi:peptidoglycan-binding domain-containing protein [Cellulomonas edaphi]|uniref:Peptidoglycan-binding domain-containing protein n=1 Tax=Cellulomonas edaphi TaxID=3053468 RepID=A0ABT7S3T4_9CELL|nr:peptidoglycan-binding domain-containing protein [Cellulomons edaphi]MDM7830184.1 peptidoglycan-binding domain-containing protein [Cellulomons edaphi]
MTSPGAGGHRSLLPAALSLAGCLALVLTACSSTPESDLTVAQANVTAKEKALADAEQAAADAGDALCSASSSYITALDRYGDVLHQTAVTVGDVQTAGADLGKPAAATKDAALDAKKAQDDVAQAQEDLDDAQAALVEAQASASATPQEPAKAETPTPLATLPAGSVSRVEEAEDEFEATQEGISADTPLVEAAEKFNAAAVALEAAWIHLFADSGCLSEDQAKQADANVSAYTKALQTSLKEAELYKGDVDGIYGPQTVAAVEELQKANDLPVTGTMDKASQLALQSTLGAKAGVDAAESTASTAALQQTLTLAGYWDGPVDGEPSDELTAAVKQAQKDLGVPATGEVDAATVAAFEQALADLQEPEPAASPDPAETAESDPTPSETPED